jgi:uncharacterized 2Fe-2S/4Fe-4S cluster protein (DUF4445 family)
LLDSNVRSAVVNVGSATALTECERLWSQLNSDPRLATIKHFRNKFTAHLAIPKPGIPLPHYREVFDFSKLTASVMEKFAQGAGATTEHISETEDSRIEATKIF